ncbi:thiol reductant ABC exporter subunit CydC [Alkalihalobacterium alkalinitrilicum]|uniref:thiol reductant ABC exporter subunit CydC n=1 Tax=Alkalihalobacterium alkalinitrilicum TaxID=427920 RepID=UPI000995A3BA|nr:thiol reductant ABC exporter subunit CydC [Alkalihalobacterium alkalinitrilicum]
MTELRKVMKLMIVEKKDIILSILFGFLAGVAAVGLFANSGYLISKAALLPPLYVLTLTIAFLKLFSFIRAFSRYGERFYSHRATFTILSKLRCYFFERLEPIAPTIFHNYKSGDLLSRIVGDVESLQNYFLRVYYPPIVMVIVFLATISFTLLFSIEIALILLIGLVVTGFLVPLWFALRRKSIENKIRDIRGKLSTDATEFMYGFLDLKIYQKLEGRKKQLVETSNSYIEKQVDSGKQLIFNQSINRWVSLMITWLILLVGAILIGGNELDGVYLAMLIMISLTVFENSTPMAAFPIYYEDSRRSTERLFTVLREVEEVKPSQTYDSKQTTSIELKNVSFSFPGEGRPTVKQLNIQLPAGSKTAIVGPSGSGKSTVISLLLKMYKDYEGQILLNELDISTLDDESVWRGINPVLQKNHFFYGTIRDNLLLVREDVSDDEIRQVLSKVLLDEFSLKSQVLEKGGNLSGGEKQRLAIARALLKGGNLWILDEPTSSVDTPTERRIFDYIFDHGRDDTLILVSHRLTGLEKMDQIIVMEQGRVIETGTFQELMARKGYFYEMKEIEKSVFL